MDETETDDVVTVGQRLREAREAKGLAIEDIAAQTRIPTRHLASLEAGEWDKLPAATYSIGFAKNYAGAVGLDRNEIGEQLRSEMGRSRPTYANPEVFEAADPARTMPKGLVLGALGLLAILVLVLSWLNSRSLEPEEVAAAENTVAPVPAQPPPLTVPAAARPVVLTATDAVWIQVKDGPVVLKQGELARGERFEVPASASAPVLTTGKPEALRVTVGTEQAPPLGAPGRTVSDVSLKGDDLLRQGAAASQPAAAPPRPSAASSPLRPRQAPRQASAPVPADNAPPEADASNDSPSEATSDTPTQP